MKHKERLGFYLRHLTKPMIDPRPSERFGVVLTMMGIISVLTILGAMIWRL